MPPPLRAKPNTDPHLELGLIEALLVGKNTSDAIGYVVVLIYPLLTMAGLVMVSFLPTAVASRRELPR